MKISGIYKIENLKNGKIYIGSSKDIGKRKASHFYCLRKNKHPSRHLQGAFNKYGEASFKMSLLEKTPIEDLIIKEQYYIDTLSSSNPDIGYNLRKDACSNTGLKRSKDSYKSMCISEEMVSLIISLRGSGKSISNISLITSIHKSVVNAYLKGKGRRTELLGEFTPEEPKRKLSKEEIEEILKLQGEGASRQKLSKLFKVSVNSISAVFIRRGIKNPFSEPMDITSQVKEVETLREEKNISAKEACKKVGISNSYYYKFRLSISDQIEAKIEL